MNITELPLPQNYYKFVTSFKKIAITNLLLSLLTFSFLFQAVTEISILHECFFLTLSAIFILYSIKNNYYQNYNQNFKNPKTIIGVIVELMFTFRMPYYSLVFFSSIIIAFFMVIFSLVKYLSSLAIFRHTTFMKLIEFTVILILGVFLPTMYGITEQGIYRLRWSTILYIPSITTYIFLLFRLYLIQKFIITTENCQNLVKRVDSPFINNQWKCKAFIVFLMKVILILNVEIYVRRSYASRMEFIQSAGFVFIVSWVFSLVSLYFGEEIALLSHSPYLDSQIAYRTHYRCFFDYKPQSCQIPQINQKWHKQPCILCQNDANIINMPCGHLTLCQKCSNKIRKKWFKRCLICNFKLHTQYKIIVDIPQNQRYGYHKSFFIEKIRHHNKYQIKQRYFP